MTPKKTQEMKNEDDEYAGSTDMDEPGAPHFTLKGQFSLKNKFSTLLVLVRVTDLCFFFPL